MLKIRPRLAALCTRRAEVQINMEQGNKDMKSNFKIPHEIREAISAARGVLLSEVQEVTSYRMDELFPRDYFLQRQKQIAFEKTERLKNMSPGETTEDGWYYCGISPNTQKQMFAAPTDVGVMDWYDALSAVDRAKKQGDDSVRLPTRGELRLIFNFRHIIGGLKGKNKERGDSYWTSSEGGSMSVWISDFYAKSEINVSKTYSAGSVRLVRD